MPRDRRRLVLGVARRDRHLGAQRVLAVADASRRCAARASRRGRPLSPRTTSPIASLTTSSKRYMCAPFWCGPRSTKQSSLAVEQLLGAVGRAIRMTFSTFGDADARERDVDRRQLRPGRRAGAGCWAPWRSPGQGRRGHPPAMVRRFWDPGACARTHALRLKPPGIRTGGRHGSATGRRMPQDQRRTTRRCSTGATRGNPGELSTKTDVLLADEAPIASSTSCASSSPTARSGAS